MPEKAKEKPANRGRPVVYSDPIMITGQVERSLLAKLDRYCRREGISRTAALQRAIRELVGSSRQPPS